MSFDIVIPLGPNEISRFRHQIEFTKKNIIGYRNIYIVTYNTNIQIDDCIIINEEVFPFKTFIKEYFAKHSGKSNRNGWYFQQLIKLYAGKVIENILENYLVIDADVFFLKPTHFIQNGMPIFSVGDEYHIPYFAHMKRLHQKFEKVYAKSGICHHMMFNKNYIDELFKMVEDTHQKPFWQVFILSVLEHLNYPDSTVESGASEYELYFNYMIKNHRDKIILRNLTWKNIGQSSVGSVDTRLFDFVSVCAWMP
jgi:hypothetical protein